jgi:hypothetical protein
MDGFVQVVDKDEELPMVLVHEDVAGEILIGPNCDRHGSPPSGLSSPRDRRAVPLL